MVSVSTRFATSCFNTTFQHQVQEDPVWKWLVIQAMAHMRCSSQAHGEKHLSVTPFLPVILTTGWLESHLIILLLWFWFTVVSNAAFHVLLKCTKMKCITRDTFLGQTFTLISRINPLIWIYPRVIHSGYLSKSPQFKIML